MESQVISAFITGVLANLFTKMGVGAGRKLLGKLYSVAHEGEKPVAAQDLGESPRFVARQRVYHRVDLAKEKWSWLRLVTYFHPVAGRASCLPEDWDPRSISGHFTVADFAARDLPHEDDIGEFTPSDLRLHILHHRITTAAGLRGNLDRLDSALDDVVAKHGFLPSLWPYPELNAAWVGLALELKEKAFEGLPNLNSYCGFKGLWTVVDTPAHGIAARPGEAPNIFAYAALMEIACWLSQFDGETKEYYNANFGKHALPHQYALRRVAVRLLKQVWARYKENLQRPIVPEVRPSSNRSCGKS